MYSKKVKKKKKKKDLADFTVDEARKIK